MCSNLEIIRNYYPKHKVFNFKYRSGKLIAIEMDKKKRIKRLLFIGFLVLTLTTCLNVFNLALAPSPEDDPGAYVEVKVYDGVANPVSGALVKLKAQNGWIKLDDGDFTTPWFWPTEIQTTTDSNGVAKFYAATLFDFSMTIEITVDWKYQQSSIETIDLALFPANFPTHQFVFYYLLP